MARWRAWPTGDMGAADRISFRAVWRTGLEAIRQRWWLILPLVAGLWLVDRYLIDDAVLLIVMSLGVDYYQPATNILEDLTEALACLVIIGLAISGGRRAPLRPRAMLMGLFVALPTLLLAELAVSGPGWLRNAFLKVGEEPELADLLVSGGAWLAWVLWLLALFAVVGTTVPLAIDRRLSPVGAVRGALALSAGQRWKLLWIAIGVALVELALVLATNLPFLIAGMGDHWASDLGTYLANTLEAVVLAALYLELAGQNDSAPERTAEAFA